MVSSSGPLLGMDHESLMDVTALKETTLNAYPNPFNVSTTVEFTPMSTGLATLRLVDHLGRQVSVLYEGKVEQGILHKVIIEGTELPSGIYLCTLHTNDAVITRTLILSR
jgi:hypothetical protein